jgi:ribosomal protein S18 acetylase RimI-like enzyme
MTTSAGTHGRANSVDATAVTFRRALPSDLSAIVRLLHDDELGRTREIVSEPPHDAYVAAFAAIDADRNQFLAVAVRGGQDVVGCMQLTFIPGLSHLGQWRGQIESVRVAASHRGSGLGGRFFTWAIEQCRDRGCGIVQLTTNATRTDAQRFYERLGFVPSHTGYKLAL